MAIQRYTIDGYGQLELNQVAFPRDGRIEAQCALDSTDFASDPAENGMLLAVDRVNRSVKFLPQNNVFPIALNYTTERMYDPTKNGLKDFKLELGGFLPRLGYLAVGDIFTTNCIAYDASVFADDAALEETNIKTTACYGEPHAKGAILVSKTKPNSGLALKVIEKTTMPDGQFALKFQVISI